MTRLRPGRIRDMKTNPLMLLQSHPGRSATHLQLGAIPLSPPSARIMPDGEKSIILDGPSLSANTLRAAASTNRQRTPILGSCKWRGSAAAGRLFLTAKLERRETESRSQFRPLRKMTVFDGIQAWKSMIALLTGVGHHAHPANRPLI